MIIHYNDALFGKYQLPYLLREIFQGVKIFGANF